MRIGTRQLLFATSTLALLSSLLIVGPAFAQADRLEGVWLANEVILSGCPTGNVIHTVSDMLLLGRGGALVENSDGVGIGAPPLTRLGPGLGTWAHVAGLHFTQHFTFFRYDPTDDGSAGVQVINKDIELSKDGNSYTSTGTADIFAGRRQDHNPLHEGIATRLD